MFDTAFGNGNINISLHNHSNFSDGADSLEEMIAAAAESGLKVFGISDHWIVPPYEGTDWREWGMAHQRLGEYVEQLLLLRKKYASDSFCVKIGLEVDFFFENAEAVAADLKKYPIDYLIGSVHYTGLFSVDRAAEDWIALSEAEKSDICQHYYRKLSAAAASGLYSFIGHLDLPKKFGLIDNSQYTAQAAEVLDAVAEKKGAIEINTSGWFKACGEPYPAGDILQGALQRNIPIVISSDAHCKQHIQRNFNEACWLLEGLKNSI